jgi:hypothetical protein
MKKLLITLFLISPLALFSTEPRKETIELVREIGIAEAYLKRMSGHPIMNVPKEIVEKLPKEFQDSGLEVLLARYLETRMSEEEIVSGLRFFETEDGAALAKALYKGRGNFDQTDEMIQNWIRFRMRMIEQIKKGEQQ